MQLTGSVHCNCNQGCSAAVTDQHHLVVSFVQRRGDTGVCSEAQDMVETHEHEATIVCRNLFCTVIVPQDVGVCTSRLDHNVQWSRRVQEQDSGTGVQ